MSEHTNAELFQQFWEEWEAKGISVEDPNVGEAFDIHFSAFAKKHGYVATLQAWNEHFHGSKTKIGEA